MSENNNKPTNNDILVNTITQVKTHYVGIKTLKLLLDEKGIISEAEFDEKFNEIFDDSAKEVVDFLISKDNGENE